MASGHVNRTNRGRTHGRTDQYCTREKSPCQNGAVHTWPIGRFDSDGAAKFPCARRPWDDLDITKFKRMLELIDLNGVRYMRPATTGSP